MSHLLSTDKACYAPGEAVSFSLNALPEGKVTIRYQHLGKTISEQTLSSLTWTWQPPTEDYQGYMAELHGVSDGKDTIYSTIGIDVSSNPARFPRNGFLSSYGNMSKKDIETVMNDLKHMIMRKILCILLTALVLASCNFLERQPWDSVDTTNGFQTAADAEAAVNACYQPLQWAKLYNMRIWTLDIIAGESVVGAGGGEDGIETVDLANFIANADNFAALDLWRGPSPGILHGGLEADET